MFLAALNALPDFLNSLWVYVLMQDGVVDGVAIDFSTSPASLDVTADDGTVNGESDAAYAASLIPNSFEGVPVEVTKVQVIDLTTDASVFGTGSN